MLNFNYEQFDDMNAIVSYKDILKVSQIIRCGPMELREINSVEKQILNNGCIVYWLSTPYKKNNSFSVACIRNLVGDKIFKVTDSDIKRDYTVICFIDNNLNSIMDERYKTSINLIKLDEDENVIEDSVHTTYKVESMSDDDYLWIIHNDVLTEASLLIDQINGLYFMHGFDNWKDALYDAFDIYDKNQYIKTDD